MTYNLDTPFQPFLVFLRSSEYSSVIGINDKNNLRFDLNSYISSTQNVTTLVSLHSFSFTNSFYNINANNCCIYYTDDNVYIISTSLPLGNYDIDDLIALLNSLFVNTLVFAYSLRTMKVTVTSTIPFRFASGVDNIYEVLGFPEVISDTTLSTTNTSPFVFNMIGIQQLNICLSNLNLKSIGVKNSGKKSIIDSVQVTSPSGSVQHYCNCDNFRYMITDNLVDFLNVVIYDQDFRPVDFNNIDWFMSVKFEFCYEKQFIQPSNYLTDGGYNDNEMYRAYMEEEKRQILNKLRNNNF